ncbi:MAG TPA: NADH-quinone oxidoreductase subunit L [Candidatus Rubrimentiphilum sp.]|nr:NADH-quinone oxidoreductase subunit L [Candidatus Rubrimentiphilum sp.]
MTLLLIWLLPLAAAIVNWTFGPQLKRMAGIIGSAAVGLSFVAALAEWNAATGAGAHQHLFSWMAGFDFGLLLDPLSLIWTLIITGVGFLILFYSIGYMWSDPAIARFFAYMNFFVFAMLTLVLSDNFVGLLVGWGLVGLASYFLIGFWFYKPTAVAAARKAFVINVVGDVGMMFAIFMIFAKIGSLSFASVFSNVGALDGWLVWVCVFLFIGAAAKSAQIPLHTWLPDAMEGPTPVSALIHAATMVTAGVYLVARCWPLWSASHEAQMLVGTIGGLTALAGALLGMAQWDIKRILAYSTMSQIGYMIMGVGVTAYQAGVAHFFTHAFFKACLFLGAGIVIHQLADEQDIRRMGGMRTRAPVAFWAMFASVLAISGFPGFSGFFSKDAVVYGALEHGHPWLYAAGIITAGITAYYMFRLFFVTFFGTYRGGTATAHDEHDAPHAPSWIMAAPVAILGVFAVIAGYVMAGSNSLWSRLFAQTFPKENLPPVAISELWTTVILFAVMAAGIAIAYLRYATPAALADAPARLQLESERLPAPLVKLFYFDEIIDWLVVKPSQALGRFFGSWFDPDFIDGAVRGVVGASLDLANVVRGVQTGLLRSYALVVVLGAAAFAIYYALQGAVH